MQLECCKKSVHGRLKSLSAWEEIRSPSSVLSVIKEGYKLVLLTCHQGSRRSHSCQLYFNRLESTMGSEPSNCVHLSRGENTHLFKYKSRCKDISTAPQLLGEGYYLYTFNIKSAYHHVEILTAIGSTLDFNGHFRANQAILFLTYYHSTYLLHLTYSPKC